MQPSPRAFEPDDLAPHASWIRALALRLVRDAATADDLVQETFLAALRRRPAADRPLGPWLATVLRRQAASRRRTERRRDEHESAALRPASADAAREPSELVARAESHRRLVGALLELREPYRTTLLLRFFEGLAPREIARRQGLPGSTVRTHLERGLVELRAKLSERAGGDERSWALGLVPLAAAAPGAGAGSPLLLALALAMSTPARWGAAAVACGLLLFALRSGLAAPEPGAGDSGATPPGPLALEAPAPAPAAPGNELATLAAPDPIRTPVAAEPTAPPSAPTTAPIRGRVTETDTDRPVPHFQVRLTANGETELVETDAAGRFATRASFGPGPVVAEPLDHPDSLNAMLMEGALAAYHPPEEETFPRSADELGRELALEVSVGPSYRLDWTAGAALEPADLLAELFTGGPCSYGREPVRAGPPAWVRFGSMADRSDGRDLWRLRLTSRDGLWCGETEVDEPAADGDAPWAFVELAPTACVELRVRREDGTPLGAPEGLFAELRGADESWRARPNELRGVRGRPATSTADSTSWVARFPALSGEELSAAVRMPGFEPWERTLRPRAGETTAIDVLLRRAEVTLTVSGEVRSRSGRFDGIATILLRSESPGTFRSEYPDLVERDGELVGTFAFEGLLPGTYQLLAFAGGGNRRWSGLPERIDRTTTGLVLVYEDEQPVQTLRVEILAEETGAPCADASRVVDLDGFPRRSAGPSFELEDVPLGAAVAIYAFAPGRVPRWIDASDFAPTADGDLQAVVRLPLGWGARFRAVDAASDAPLAGVRVLAGGVEIAATGSEGIATIELEREPDALAFEAAGRELVASPLDPETGRLAPDLAVHELRFR